jgi:hypothetical protein
MGLHSNGRLLALPTNVILGWKLMAVVNALAYYDTESITSVKSSTTHAQVPMLKTFLFVIYAFSC